MKFTVIDPGTGYELHKAGCKDLRQPNKVADIKETFDADSVEAALTHYFDEELVDLGWDCRDCRVFPCVKEARN